jgi:cyclopropane fatty-acyl-phospholipid synthase-like methyltransferase
VITSGGVKMSLMRNFRKLFSFIHKSDNYYTQYFRVKSMDLGSLSIYRNLKEEIGNNSSILDFGSGLGYITSYLGATGVEINPKAIKAAREFFPKTEFKSSTVKELAQGKKYSAVVCVNVIEHLEDAQREEWFEAVSKILKKNGKLYVVYDSMYHPLQILSGFIHPGMLLTDPSHVYCWTQEQFKKVLERNFNIIKVKPGNILTLFLPFTNRFKTAVMYVCEPKK